MLTHHLDPIFYEDYDQDSSKDSNQDSYEDYALEGITEETCGSFIDLAKCAARQTMDALKNVII